MKGQKNSLVGEPGETLAQGTRRSWSRDSYHVTAEEVGDQIVLHVEMEWGKELELPIALTLVGTILALSTGAAALVSLEWTLGLFAALETILVVGGLSAYRRTIRNLEQLRTTFEFVNFPSRSSHSPGGICRRWPPQNTPQGARRWVPRSSGCV